jgi:hypothetical protein
MSSDAAHTAMTDTSGDIVTDMADASLADRQEAIPGLPNHLVIAHILRSEYFDDPADLARLKAVGSAMRDAIDARRRCTFWRDPNETKLRVTEYCAEYYAELGCLSALKRLHRKGFLSQEYFASPGRI